MSDKNRTTKTGEILEPEAGDVLTFGDGDGDTEPENSDSGIDLDEAAFDDIEEDEFAEPEESGEGPKETPNPTLHALEVERLNRRIQNLEEQLDRTLNAYRREKGELERIRERLERDRERKLVQDKTRAFAALFGPLDVLHRSIDEAEKGGNPKAILEGFKLVYRQIVAGLEEAGLKRFDPTGELFDPEFHEALMAQPVKKRSEDNRVLMVTKAGYTADGQLVRPAQVIVGKYE